MATSSPLSAVVAAGASASVDTAMASFIGYQVYASSTATGCTVKIQQSVLGTVWNDIATVSNPAAAATTGTLSPYSFTRANVTVYAGVTAFTGSGLNDATYAGVYTGTTATTFDVEIDATGTPDTFKWRKGTGSYTTGVAITGAAQTLSNGVTIAFNATTGHTVGNKWTLTLPSITADFDVQR